MQSIITLIVIPYTIIGPKHLPSFYHLYAEVICECILAILWLASFADMAAYSSAVDGFFILFEVFGSIGSDYLNALNCSKAVAGLGGILL